MIHFIQDNQCVISSASLKNRRFVCDYFGCEKPVVETKPAPVNNPMPSNTAKAMGSLFD